MVLPCIPCLAAAPALGSSIATVLGVGATAVVVKRSLKKKKKNKKKKKKKNNKTKNKKGGNRRKKMSVKETRNKLGKKTIKKK